MTNILDVINDGLANDDYLDSLLTQLSNEHDEQELTSDLIESEFEHELYDNEWE